MTHTFLVTVDTGSDSDLAAIADDILEALETRSDLMVMEVKPWSPHNSPAPTPVAFGTNVPNPPPTVLG